jgi:predicted nucleic acid-binding protein
LASRLDVLGEMVKGPPASPWQHVTTDIVAQELQRGQVAVPNWIQVEQLTSLHEVVAFATWSGRLSNGIRDIGEASIAAWASEHGAIAITDDKDAKEVMSSNGCTVHGSLWLLCQAINVGLVDVASVSTLADAALSTGARFPFKPRGFVEWAKSRELLQ